MKKLLWGTAFGLLLLNVAIGAVLLKDTPSYQIRKENIVPKHKKEKKVAESSIKLDDEKIISTSLVLYENGRGFVSQTRQVTLSKGKQTINFGKVPRTLILSSATVSGDNIVTQTTNFDPYFDNKTYYEIAQEEAIGKDVVLLWTVWKDGQKTELKQNAKLLAVENREPVLLIDGFIHKGTDARILYPALDKQIDHKTEKLDFTIVSETDKMQEITFSYLAEGFNWNTNYNVYLDEDKNEMTLKGFVELKNNSYLDYNDANIDFVLGEINTEYSKLPSQEEEAQCQINNKNGLKLAIPETEVNGKIMNPKAIDIEDGEDDTSAVFDMVGNVIGRIVSNYNGAEILPLKDYYVYRLPFTTTLKQKQPLTALFLDKTGLKYQKEYVFNDAILITSTTNIQNIAPSLYLIFENNKNAGVDMPLPKGTFHVFNNKNNQSFFIGESSIDKTISLGQKATIKVGDALDVYANVKQIAKKELSDEKSEFTYEVEIRNISDETKKIKFNQVLKLTDTFVKTDLKPLVELPHEISWSMDIPAQTNKVFTFTVVYTNLELIQKRRDAELAKEKLAAEEAKLEAEKEYQRLKLKR